MIKVVLLVIFVVLVVAWVALTLMVRRKRAEGAAAARELLGGDAAVLVFDEKAVCRGSESGPFNAWVGMGSLGVSADEIVFLRWSPRDELRIARTDVIEHVFTTEYLGRQYRKPILQLVFRNPEHTDGETPGQDCIAWEVTDPDVWNDVLGG